MEEVDERRGLLVRRERGEGCVEDSVSSTSNDLFSAGGERTQRVRPLASYCCLSNNKMNQTFEVWIGKESLWSEKIFFPCEQVHNLFVHLAKANATKLCYDVTATAGVYHFNGLI